MNLRENLRNSGIPMIQQIVICSSCPCKCSYTDIIAIDAWQGHNLWPHWINRHRLWPLGAQHPLFQRKRHLNISPGTRWTQSAVSWHQHAYESVDVLAWGQSPHCISLHSRDHQSLGQNHLCNENTTWIEQMMHFHLHNEIYVLCDFTIFQIPG